MALTSGGYPLAVTVVLLVFAITILTWCFGMPSADELTSFSGTNQICGIVEDLTVHSMALVPQLAYLRLVVLLVYFDSYIFVVAISVLIGIGLEVDDACQYLVLLVVSHFSEQQFSSVSSFTGLQRCNSHSPI
jgi:hypothetical protein